MERMDDIRVVENVFESNLGSKIEGEDLGKDGMIG